MSQAVLRQTSGSGTEAVSLAALFVRAAEYLVREWKIGLALSDVGRLDERALHDIGLGTGEIEHAVRHGRPPSRSAVAIEDPTGGAVPFYERMPASFTEWR